MLLLAVKTVSSIATWARKCDYTKNSRSIRLHRYDRRVSGKEQVSRDIISRAQRAFARIRIAHSKDRQRTARSRGPVVKHVSVRLLSPAWTTSILLP